MKFSKDTLVFPHTTLSNTGMTTLEEYFCPFLDLNTTYSSCPRTPNTKWQTIRPWLHATAISMLEHMERNPFSASLPSSAWHAPLCELLDHCPLVACVVFKDLRVPLTPGYIRKLTWIYMCSSQDAPMHQAEERARFLHPLHAILQLGKNNDKRPDPFSHIMNL